MAFAFGRGSRVAGSRSSTPRAGRARAGSGDRVVNGHAIWFPPCMKRSNPLRCFLALALLGADANAFGDELPVHLGDPARGGELRAFAEGTGDLLAPDSALRGVRLLPIQLNAWLERDAARPDHARQRSDLVGLGRVELPNGLGVLHRFERRLPGGARRFGFLRVDGVGDIHLLAERSGSGAHGADDAYVDRVTIAPDATTFLTCTKPAAGGDVLEVDLVSGIVVDRTPQTPPVNWLPQSLRRGTGWTLAVARDGVWRGGALPGDALAPVALPGAPSRYTGEVVLSADGSHAVTTAGSGSALLHAFVLDASGPAVRATRDAQRLAGAGFAPEALHGPFLAVSDDGSHCAWRRLGATAQLSNELFLRRTAAPAQQAGTQVTADALVTDTLDEVGVLTLFQPDKLLVAIGEKGGDPGVGIEKVDLFEVSLDPGGAAQLVNRTGSSGDFSAPFLAAPTITPLERRWIPAAQAEVFHDETSGGGGRFVAVRPGVSGVQVLDSDVKEVQFVEVVGARLVVALRRASGNKPYQLVSWPANLMGAPVVHFDAGDDELLQPSVGGDWVAFAWRGRPVHAARRIQVLDGCDPIAGWLAVEEEGRGTQGAGSGIDRSPGNGSQRLHCPFRGDSRRPGSKDSPAWHGSWTPRSSRNDARRIDPLRTLSGTNHEATHLSHDQCPAARRHGLGADLLQQRGRPRDGAAP